MNIVKRVEKKEERKLEKFKEQLPSTHDFNAIDSFSLTFEVKQKKKKKPSTFLILEFTF